jgi:hypothetical protein
MKHSLLFALALICSSSVAQATVTTFTNSGSFFAAAPRAALVEDFDDFSPAIWNIGFTSLTSPSGQITFVPLTNDLYPLNVIVAPAGYTNFGEGLNPTSSAVLTVTGNEDILGTLASPAGALGLNVLLNDQPGTLSFFNGSTLLATLTFDSPPIAGNNFAFGGIISTEGVTSFRWTASNGQNVNTGIDNIYAGPAPDVPEPGTWAMMLLGFALSGAALRIQKANLPGGSAAGSGVKNA